MSEPLLKGYVPAVLVVRRSELQAMQREISRLRKENARLRAEWKQRQFKVPVTGTLSKRRKIT